MTDIKLTSMTQNGGWAAKVEPSALSQVLCQLPKIEDSNLLVGFDTSDDAAVYNIYWKFFRSGGAYEKQR